MAIDKAVESGLVRRRPDEEDGRAWRVTLERNAPTKQLAEQFELYESTLKEKYTKEELRLGGRVLDDWISLLEGDTWLPWSKKGD